MAGKSDYLSHAILNHVFRGVAMPTISGVYFALFTVMPDDDGTGGTEVSGGSYARVQVTRDTDEWTAAAAGEVENENPVTYPQASGDWGTVIGAAAYDAATVGNMLYSGTLAASKIVNTGDVFKFNPGDLTGSED